MRRARLASLGTHYQPRADGTVRVFTLTDCEACGVPCEAPNAVNVGASPAVARAAGLSLASTGLEEIGHCEALGLAVCPACYVSDARSA